MPISTTKRLLVAVAIAAFAIALPLAAYLGFLFVSHDYDRDFLSIDRCLDHGGAWDYAARRCSR